ncbi:MAG TPA: bifunctional diaminohydroxyphosphoribosylaminopyrimidine deaminase/5-amino-6-(5-phosphoribosylamino)uracil reductase RibD [Mizugakiibacter sp.]
MARALRLAERGLYTTQPNPRVGCVLAHGEEVVGEGWHARAGEPHAEVHALRTAGARARGATAYVSLEPCAHHGRTPPCADALVAAGVARVVVAAEDPNPRVDGRGLEKLRAAGIAVESGLMRDAAREINCGFLSRLERGRPWLRLKLAMSLDGRTALANGASQWITGEAARADVQRWRARSSALLTGSGTVLADDPRLTVRLPALAPLSPSGGGQGEGGGREAPMDSPAVAREAARAAVPPHPSPLPGGERETSSTVGFVPPLRVVLDRALRTPASAHVLDAAAPTLLLHAPDAVPPAHLAAVECAPLPTRDGRLDLDAALRLLAVREVNEVQVEAGPTLAGALFAAGLVDELLLYVAPVLLGDAARPLLALPTLTEMAQRWRLRTIDQRQLGDDLRLRLRLRPA